MREIVEEPPWAVIEAELAKDPLTKLIDAQDGVIARWQALRHLSGKELRHRIDSGRWRRMHRGIFQAYGGDLTVRQRQWAAVLAATPSLPAWQTVPACLSGLSALQVHGLKRITTGRVQILVPWPRRAVVPAGVDLHQSREFPDEDRHPLRTGLPCTTTARAVVDAAAWARSDDEARLVVVSTFQQRLVTERAIAEVLDRLQSAPRRNIVLATARDAASGSHSIGELDFVKLCRSAGLPVPTRQLLRRDSSGRRRYLDAVFEPWKIVVEIDGAQHASVDQSWDDAVRQNDLVLNQYVVLRFPVHIVRTQPQTVVAAVRAALINAGWRP